MDILASMEIKEIAVNSNLKTELTNAEIPSDEESTNKNNITKTGETVPYILNGELYKILARNGENVTVKCCSCPSGRFYRGSVRSTGNFHMHIKRRHPCLLGKLHEMKVHSLLERRDRLLKNRKAKLRRILVTNAARDEHELHKLKIKRAFQRHQEEAKVNKQEALSEDTEIEITTYQNPKEMLIETIVDCKGNSITTEQIKESSSNDEHSPAPTSSSAPVSVSVSSTSTLPSTSTFLSSNNVFCDSRMFNDQSSKDIRNDDSSVPIQQTPPNVLSFPNTSNDMAVICEFSPLSSYSQSKIIHNLDIIEQHPLDLSINARSPANVSNASSGIGLEPMWSNTTVPNTVSSIGVLGTNISGVNYNSSPECSDTVWWQQRLALILCDIRNDIRTRNQIEHNRLLLEIEKVKFLNPDFCFNIQN